MMSSFTLRFARSSDLEALVELVGRVVPECHPETVWQLPWTWPSYVVAETDTGCLAAAGSLQPIDGARAEIRGLVVGSHFRGEGLATRMVRHLVGIAGTRGLETVCVTRKPDFFARLGFQGTPLTWIPPERRLGSLKSDADRVGMTARVS